MATAQRFEDLKIWQLAREINKVVIDLSRRTALNKDFELKDQMNRSSGSAMDNIAEGFGRGGRFEFINFLTISRGSATELQSQSYRCLDKGYINEDFNITFIDRITILIKQITTFITYLNKTNIAGQKFKDRT